MRTLLSIALIPFLLSAAAGQNQPAASKATLQGTIADPATGAIQAFVLVHSDRAGNPTNIQVPVSPDGEFRADLAPGLYDMFIASPGFLPIAKVIEIRSGKPLTMSIVMQPDEQHHSGIPY